MPPQVRPASGIKGLFHRNPKQSSLDSHAAAQLSRKSAFGAHLLRRTASEPTKGQAKAKKGFPEISINTKDCSSEGTSEDRDTEDGSRPRCDRERDSPAAGPRDCTNGEAPPGGSKGKGPSSLPHHRRVLSEPLRRASRVPAEKHGVYARVALSGSGRVGVASNCIRCMLGSKESPDIERKLRPQPPPQQAKAAHLPKPISKSIPEQLRAKPPAQADLPPKSHNDPTHRLPLRASLQPMNSPHSPGHRPPAAPPGALRDARSCSVPRRRIALPAGPVPISRTSLRSQVPVQLASIAGGNNAGFYLTDTDSSSGESVGSPAPPPAPPPPRGPHAHHRCVGTLQREMNALFSQKMEEVRSKSPMFFSGKVKSGSPSSQ